MASPIATTSKSLLVQASASLTSNRAATATAASAASAVTHSIRNLSTSPSSSTSSIINPFQQPSSSSSSSSTGGIEFKEYKTDIALADSKQVEIQESKLESSSSSSSLLTSSLTEDDQTRRRRMTRTMISQLEGMGSEQTRRNTFRPHKLRLDPISASNLTLSHLVASTAQVGHSISSLSRANQPNIYGVRNGSAILNLETSTLPSLKRAASVVRAITERDGVILFVGTRPGQQACVLSATRRLKGNGFHVTAERWIPGVITNAPKLLAPAILSSMKGQQADQVPNTAKLASQTLQPDLVIVLNPLENSYAIREATQANIPTMAITDTDVDPRSVTYPIPANDDSLRTVELIVGVLSKAGEEGLQRRATLLEEEEKLVRKVERRRNNLNAQASSSVGAFQFDPRQRSRAPRVPQRQESEEEGTQSSI
ncbi:ribosomal protein S2 [Violaceomyces palustris]|uniref:Ribosomal protein S2 n=1 Tax=Violaceomyces palustris TaxID=1673888 RepID=A0ACD0NM04_9BASI|nr:ribosomal protein S2 [Violaceomyces palustris]